MSVVGSYSQITEWLEDLSVIMKKNTINTINNKCKETEILNDMIMNEYRMNPRL